MEDKKKKYLYVSGGKSICYDETTCYCNGKVVPRQPEDADVAVDIIALNMMRTRINEDLERLLGYITNVAVLTAAGTSLDNYENSGKTRTTLWEHCLIEINAIIAFLDKQHLKDKVEDYVKAKDIEKLLSYLLLYERVNSKIPEDLVEKLEKKIAEACKLDLHKDNNHHGLFLRKLTSRKLTYPRLELYTLNYDTLFEQAAKRLGYTIIDGFSFSHPREFSGRNYNFDIVRRENSRMRKEENYAPDVFKLFKLHGSIDWEKVGGKIYQKESVDKPCIVYPASDKYESSYDQPYFEMMSHFQQTLRKDSTLLIVVGFGFQDKHIQNAIKEASLINSNFHLLIVCYQMDKDGQETGILQSSLPDYVSSDYKTPSNVTVIFSKFKEFADMIPHNKSFDIINDKGYETI